MPPHSDRPVAVGHSLLALALPLLLLVPAPASQAARARHEAVGKQLFESPQVNPIALNAAGTRLYVANTTSNSVSVVDRAALVLLGVVEVGVEPVSLAVRPGGGELWVANHVSDTVSIIDVAPGSPTENRVVDTVQDVDADGVTAFDEPAGIAFSTDGSKAFVALSSRDQIAVVDAATRAVTARIKVRGQDPRAIAVRGNLLYVAAFEGGNQTETGACPTENNNNAQCTLGQSDLATFAVNPNIPGEQKNIVVDTANPDRDLFVYRTDTHAEVAAVSGVGTLLYGVAVSSAGRAFVTQTDARNAVNGIVAPAASRQDPNGDGSVNLRDLANRMFTNEIAATTCTVGGCGAVTITDLEPGLVTPLATPYAIAISGNDQTLVATAMGSSRVFTLNATSMAILDTLDLGSVGAGNFGQQMPRGIALFSDAGTGAPLVAYVLNSFENTVSVIDVSNPSNIAESSRFGVGSDPTPPEVRRGRIAFNNAFASSNGTFSCGSCHPDGHTDQLLWRIGGECFLGGCVAGEDEPRSTMPVRGLKNTLPLHWDGTLGDPFGGGNGQVGNGGTPVDPSQACNINDADGDHDCFRDLVNASLSGVMCEQTPSCAAGPSGLPGPLTDAEREDMAFFLASVSFPPARSRRIDDTLSTPADPVAVPNADGTPSATTANAVTGFQDFFTNQGGVGDPDTCADSTAGCHTLPLGGGTNSSTLAGFDIPSMRGLTDRVLQFSLGITNPREILLLANAGVAPFTSPLEAPIQFSTTQGFREITTFGSAFLIFQPVYGTRPLHSFQMFEEASTGYSGAQARQIALNVRTTTGGALAQTDTLMAALELADGRGLVNLRAVGVRDTGSGPAPVVFSYRSDGLYKNAGGTISLSHAQLVAEAQAGDAILTLTAALRPLFGSAEGAQPLLGACVSGCSTTTGDPSLPNFPTGGAADPPAFTVVGTDVRTDAAVFVDGAPAVGTVACGAGSTGSYCNDGNVSIDLAVKPAAGLHLVQVLNPSGPLSNELPLCVGTSANCN